MRELLKEEILSLITDLGKTDPTNTTAILKIQGGVTRIIAVLELNPGSAAEGPLRKARELIVDGVEAIQKDQDAKGALTKATKKLERAAELI